VVQSDRENELQITSATDKDTSGERGTGDILVFINQWTEITPTNGSKRRVRHNTTIYNNQNQEKLAEMNEKIDNTQ